MLNIVVRIFAQEPLNFSLFGNGGNYAWSGVDPASDSRMSLAT